MTIRVILVEENFEARERFRALLHGVDGIGVVGVADDVVEVMKVLDKLSAEVVLVDLSLPKTDGFETARQIIASRPEIKVLMYSLQAEPHYVKKSFEAGASGYLLKDCAFEELKTAIRKVAGGGTYISPEIEMDTRKTD